MGRAEAIDEDLKSIEVDRKEHGDKYVQYPRKVGRKRVAVLHEASLPVTETSDSSLRSGSEHKKFWMGLGRAASNLY